MRGLLANSSTYETFQQLTGAAQGRAFFVKHHVKPQPNQCVLDIGCGTGYMAEFFPNTEYHGFDPSEDYINKARSRNWPNSTFSSLYLDEESLPNKHYYDVVHSTGVLHHVDDEEALRLLRVAALALKPGGKFFTLDGCWLPGQSLLSKAMLYLDRGRFVREEKQYRKLADRVFKKVVTTTYQHLFRYIPYTVVIMEMSEPK